MQVELTGETKYYNVIDSKSKEWTVIEMYDGNSDSTEFDVIDADGDEPCDKKRAEIIEAVEKFS